MKHTFLKAGHSHSEPVSGSFIYIAKASGSVRIEALANGQSFVWPDLERGEQVRLPNDLECTKLSVTSLVDDNEVVIKVGQGRFYPRMDSAGLTIDSIRQGIDVNASATVKDGNVSVDIASENLHLPIVDCPPRSTVLLADGNPSQKELRLNIDVNQVGGLFMGGAGVSHGFGGYIEAGTTEYMQTNAALYVYNPNDDVVSVSVMSLQKN